jgi:hypothetical protein
VFVYVGEPVVDVAAGNVFGYLIITTPESPALTVLALTPSVLPPFPELAVPVTVAN